LKAGRIYRITQQSHDPDNNIQEVVDISDMDYLIDDADTTEIVTLEPGGNPIKLKTVDNEEDPFTVVKGQRLTLEVNTDNPINLSTFASGSDQRWAVHLYIGANTLFKGWLVLDDISIDFMPDPSVLVLTATDGYGGLSDMPLLDADGNNPVGEYKLIELLKMALDGTGYSLGIKAAFNIKNEGFIDDISIPNANDQHFFSINYLNAKTFEAKIGSCISRKEVLEYILGEEGFIFQRQGYHWIVRVDEIEQNRGLYITEWDEDGVFVGNLGEQDFNKDIGKDSPYTIYFSRELTKVYAERPKKSVQLRFAYQTPIEIVENIDFERGDLVTTVSPTEKLYDIADWGLFEYTGSSLDIPGTSAYIRRVFENDYEKERYAVIMPGTQQDYYLVSSRWPVGQKDRFEFNLEVSYNGQPHTGGTFRRTVAQIRLYGSDGTFYTFDGGTSVDQERGWVACTSDFSTNQNYFVTEGNGVDDDTLWRSISQYGSVVDTTIPKDGHIVIILRANFETDTWETRFNGLRFDYIPYINGSYAKYNAQTQTVSQSGNYKAKREKDIMVSESPRMGLKGTLLQGLLYNQIFSGSVTFTASNSFKIAGYQLSLFRKGQRLNISGTTSNNITETRVTEVEYSIIGSETIIHIEDTTTTETDASTLVQELTYQIADEFYNAATAPDGPPDSTYIHPYSEIQVYDVFNQFNRDGLRVFRGNLQGLDLDALDGDLRNNGAHFIHKWFVTDATDDTYNRMFQLLTFDQDHRTAEWTGVFREVFNLGVEKVYTGREFKYEQ
jgi:hypothetical protein